MDEKTRKYEMIVIVDARLNSEEKTGLIDEVKEVIQKNEGNVVNAQVWIEKQKLTFEINKCKEGSYYLINFEGPADIDAAIRPSLKLKEKVLRYSVIKVEKLATVKN